MWLFALFLIVYFFSPIPALAFSDDFNSYSGTYNAVSTFGSWTVSAGTWQFGGVNPWDGSQMVYSNGGTLDLTVPANSNYSEITLNNSGGTVYWFFKYVSGGVKMGFSYSGSTLSMIESGGFSYAYNTVTINPNPSPQTIKIITNIQSGNLNFKVYAQNQSLISNQTASYTEPQIVSAVQIQESVGTSYIDNVVAATVQPPVPAGTSLYFSSDGAGQNVITSTTQDTVPIFLNVNINNANFTNTSYRVFFQSPADDNTPFISIIASPYQRTITPSATNGVFQIPQNYTLSLTYCNIVGDGSTCQIANGYHLLTNTSLLILKGTTGTDGNIYPASDAAGNNPISTTAQGTTVYIDSTVYHFDNTTHQYYYQIRNQAGALIQSNSVITTPQIGAVQISSSNFPVGIYNIQLYSQIISNGSTALISQNTLTVYTGLSTSQALGFVTDSPPYVGSLFGFSWNINAFDSSSKDYWIEARDPTGYLSAYWNINSANSTTSKNWNFNLAGTWTEKLYYYGWIDFLHLFPTTIATFTQTVLPVSSAGGFSVTTNKASYQIGDTMTYTVVNPSNANIYLTVIDSIGNIPAGNFPANDPILSGIGVVNIQQPVEDNAVAQNYTAVLTSIQGGFLVGSPFGQSNYLATTTFNITLPSSGSDSLGLQWIAPTTVVGYSGIVQYKGNYNISNLYVYRPDKTLYRAVNNIAGNGSGSLSITFDQPGAPWGAFYSDVNGNVAPPNGWRNLSISGLSGQIYFSSDINGIKKITNTTLTTVYLQTSLSVMETGHVYGYQINNPSGTVFQNGTINRTSLSTFQVTFTDLGKYRAVLFDNISSNVLGSTSITVNNLPPGATPTPPSGGEAVSNLGDNLKRFMAMPAFWGLLLTIFMFLIIGKTVPNVMGFGMFLVLNIEAVIGLYDPYKFYILAVTWVFAGIYFSLGRKVLTGG